MKLKKIASKAKQNTVSFFKDPKKVQGLAIGIVGTLTAALLVDEVKTSKHKKELKEVKDASLKQTDYEYTVGYKFGNLDTLSCLNADDKISKEDAIANSVDFDNFIKEQFADNDQLLEQYNDIAGRNQEKFEDMLN